MRELRQVAPAVFEQALVGVSPRVPPCRNCRNYRKDVRFFLTYAGQFAIGHGTRPSCGRVCYRAGPDPPGLAHFIRALRAAAGAAATNAVCLERVAAQLRLARARSLLEATWWTRCALVGLGACSRDLVQECPQTRLVASGPLASIHRGRRIRLWVSCGRQPESAAGTSASSNTFTPGSMLFVACCSDRRRRSFLTRLDAS